MIPPAVELDSADLLDVRWRKGEHASTLVSHVYFEGECFALLPNAFIRSQPTPQAFGYLAPGRFSPGLSVVKPRFKPRRVAALSDDRNQKQLYYAHVFLNCHARFLLFCQQPNNGRSIIRT